MKALTLKTYMVLIMAFCLKINAVATDFERPLGARSWGMANASVTLDDIWSVQNNQAGLGFLKQSQLATYGENRFRLSNLNFGAVAGAVKTKYGNFALNLNYFGYTGYSEQKLGFSYSRAFTDKFSVGFRMNYQFLSIKSYGSTGTPSIDGGIIYKVSKQFITGFHICNPTMQKLDKNSTEHLPTISKIGFQYLPSEKVSLVAEVQKQTDLNALVKVGLEYRIQAKLALRAGLSSNPFLNTFGIGYSYKSMQLDMAASVHPQLGISPHASLTFLFNKQK
ncbi:MAG: hypothetical protein K1X81_07375 [Bacteroidia bacterium]|nr:hypothetical protein [Bacteroidia bacterium]